MAIKLNLNDLEFILRQIKIGEAHSNGAALTEIRIDPATGEVVTNSAMYGPTGLFLGDQTWARAIPDPKTPFGVRTVDGTYNNLVEFRETWGAADQPMPRYFEHYYLNDTDGDNIFFGNGTIEFIQGNYAPGTPSGNPMIANGSVVDADPRIISNLIADMSLNNPAAIWAALKFAGSEDPYADLNEILAARISQTQANQNVVDAEEAILLAEEALDLAIQGYVPGNSASIDAIQEAAEALTQAEAALLHAQTVAADPQAAFVALAESKGLVIQGTSLVIPNIAPDEGISAPFNAWMTFFGQFFDHGLDLISKGGAGTVYIPLQPDDPLYDADSPTNFMVVTRSVTVPGEGGVPTQRNVTTPFVDQNQTYTSHPSHQVFLREYTFDANGRTVATGRLLEGQNGGLATWADVKAQALQYLGIQLVDADAVWVPWIRTDAYGKFIPDANGHAQIIVGFGADGKPNTADDIVISSATNGGNPVTTATAYKTHHAFLDDIAHTAVPVTSTGAAKVADGDSDLGYFDALGNPGPLNMQGSPSQYDNELLDRHFITGDGRGNENFGLTAVHHVFHSEHNRQTTVQKLTILEQGNLAFVNEWLLTDITAQQLNNIKSAIAAAKASNDPGQANLYNLVNGLNLVWDGERVFQAARFATEMQYQHLVFEEFGRKIQPMIDPFVFNSVTDINPAIFAEFANVVYRFGHSMLTDEMPRAFFAANAPETNYLDIVDEGLIAAFLNPVGFDLDRDISHEEAAGAVVRGLTNTRGNAIDEFVVDALRNQLLGLPLDLAAINIARGRETGMPTLNQARTELFAQTGSSFLKPYANWTEFAIGLKNPISVVNFIAAYGTHDSITGVTLLADKRAAAMELVFGLDADGNATQIADRYDFINGLGAYASNKGGLDNVDLWIGGLAEKILLFGGMLGSTFTAIFEAQMENLQNADRFYYLTRTQGLHFLDALEANAFSKMIMANTDLALPGLDGIRGTADDEIRHHIGIDSFALYDYILEVRQQYQQDYNGDEAGKDPTGNDAVLEGLGLSKVMRTMPEIFLGQGYQNYLRFFGGEHVVLGGTSGNDILIGDLGDDAIWGGAGDDYIEGGQGVDLIMGGAGDDIILDEGDDGDFIKGDEGDDVIASSNGLDVLMGGDGKDVIFVGADMSEVFGGSGDDFILGGPGADFLMGNEGDDWIEGGGGFDTTAGDNSELFFNSRVIGHDVMFAGSDEHDFDAESGDDIMVQGESVMRNEGMFGFDWAIFKGVQRDAYADMRIKIFTTEEEDILRNRFDKVEGLSGWNYNDTLIGDDRTYEVFPDAATVNNTENMFFRDELDQAGIDRIAGLNQIITPNLMRLGVYGSDFSDEVKQIFTGGNILLGGGGSDTIMGRGGDDVIDGDHWLNVRIRIVRNGEENTAGNQIATVDSLKHKFVAGPGVPAFPPEWEGRTLFELLVDRTIRPNQLHIVREILDGGKEGDIDTAVYWDVRANYTITQNANGSITVEHTGFDPANVPDGQQLVSDGRDTLYNIERLQFADQVLSLTGPTVTNLVVLTSNGNNSQVTANVAALTASLGGVPQGGYTYTWQFSTNDGLTWQPAGATGQTYNVPGARTGDLLRVQVSWSGGFEQRVSEMTARVGTNQVDTLNGTAGSNLLVGLNGNDTINGNDGNDVIYGGGGGDTINGGAGNDTIDGGGGDDLITGGSGDDIINGGGNNDTAIYAGALQNFLLQHDGTTLTVTDLTGAEGVDSITNVETLRFNGVDHSLTIGGNGGNTHNGNALPNIIFGMGGGDTINGLGGNDYLDGGVGNDTINGGAGNDIIKGGDGNDTIIQASTEGHDLVDGGDGNDTYVLNGNAQAEIFRIYAVTNGQNAGLAATLGTTFAASTEIVITRTVGADTTVVAELDNIEEITVNTLNVSANDGNGVPNGGVSGGDTIQIIGDFTSTSLNFSTITINGSEADDTVDITALTSAHRVVFTGNGGNDTIIGPMRSQDIIETGITQFDPNPTGIYKLDKEDYRDLLEMIRSGQVRDSSGFGNNEANPSYGTAGYNFIRLTDPYYTNGMDGIRQTSLTPREISNIVSNQDNDGDGVEESIPNVFNGSSLLTFFGQYFDHGLDFVAKGAPGNVAIGNASFPINAPRSNIVEGTGVNGIPAEYINHASPFVDQNQAYGSHNAVTDLLRKWVLDGNGEAKQTAYLLGGELDSSGRALLPTLNHIRENFRIMTGGDEITSDDIRDYRGTGQALLLDFIPVFVLLEDGSPSERFNLDAIGHYFITGDGRANENVMLTSIHTIWARNHNFWVNKIKAETGGAWTEEEYFQAARMMNIAEYQQVVFTEFATAMAGPLGDDDDGEFDIEHGFEGYDPTVDASISVEFAQAAYRFGHSMLNETVVYRDADGNLQQISLVQAFLRPEQVGAIGIDALLSGATAVSHQAIDVDMVNALRNQLVGRPLDLAALNIFRGRDMGIAPFNSVREQLWELSGRKNSLRPYQGWDDFQARNGLSPALIAQLKSAYPDGFDTMDLWIGGLAEKPVHGQLGSTFGYIFREQLDRLQHGDRFYYLEIFDDSITEDNPATFANIIMRNTGITGLPANVFQHAGVIDPSTIGLGEQQDDEEDEQTAPVDQEEEDQGTGPADEEEDETDPVNQEEDEETGPSEEEEEEQETHPDPVQNPVSHGEFKVGTPGADVLMGTAGDDTLLGMGGDDVIMGGDGADVIYGGDGNDILRGEGGRDVIFGGAGNDDIFGGSGMDMLYGEAGNDRIFGEGGDDLINGGAGNDTVFGGDGNDVFVAEKDDGDDVYYGGDMTVDNGNDTLDMSAITANITADLGTGFMGRGSVSSAQTGNDTIWGIENIITGTGDDVITASRAVNVMDGGAGNDTFRFLSAKDADGDTIVGFHPGDKIDLSGIDANACVGGNQSFTLVSGAFTGVRGELLVTFEQRDGEDFTIVQGNTTGGMQADFKISLKGSHDLTASDFTL